MKIEIKIRHDFQSLQKMWKIIWQKLVNEKLWKWFNISRTKKLRVIISIKILRKKNLKHSNISLKIQTIFRKASKFWSKFVQNFNRKLWKSCLWIKFSIRISITRRILLRINRLIIVILLIIVLFAILNKWNLYKRM